MKFKVGDKLHYSGDMANDRGWFKVVAIEPGPWGDSLKSIEVPGRYSAFAEGDKPREWAIQAFNIGDEYQGHCSPRFVTEAAFNKWLRERGLS